MTVKELIEELKKYDDDEVVYIQYHCASYGTCYDNLDEVVFCDKKVCNADKKEHLKGVVLA